MTSDADAEALFKIFSTGTQMDRYPLKFPAYINILRGKDWPLPRTLKNVQGLRLTAVDFIYSLGSALYQDDSVCFAAIRFFDRFYALPDIGASDAWMRRIRLVAFVALDVAAKTLGHESNCAGSKKTLRWFYDITSPRCEYEDFCHRYRAIEVHMIQRIADFITAPPPHEYISECCDWYDATNAARCPAKTSPGIEMAYAARISSFLIAMAAYTPESINYTSMEIASICSYAAAIQLREDKYVPSSMETPLLADMWGEITWTRASSLANSVTTTILKLIKDIEFVSGAERMYPDMFSVWREHWKMYMAK